jgi:hypothetical protein
VEILKINSTLYLAFRFKFVEELIPFCNFGDGFHHGCPVYHNPERDKTTIAYS